jgi:DNA-binding NtrC family response regulator
MKRFVLFIGYEPSLHAEISEFMTERRGKAFFSDSMEETIQMMNSGRIGTVALNIRQPEDIAVLHYINTHYRQTKVLVVPGGRMQEAIPALAAGRFRIINNPLKLEELEEWI